MLGYRSPFSNTWNVQVQDDQKRVLHSIHVNWDFQSHGLSNALIVMSKDHLEALGDQWGIDLGITKENEAAPALVPLPKPQQNNEIVENTDEKGDLGEIEPDQLINNNDYFNNDPHVLIEPLPNDDSPNSTSIGAADSTSLGLGAEGAHSPTHLEIDESHILDYKRVHHNNVVEKYARIHKTNVEVALKKALNGDDASKWKAAIVKEMNSMMEHCLVLLDESHPEYETAVKEATWSRFVLTRKRDGRYKARG